ncbi:redoxin domain-containing protein [Stieleria varia]|uniref:Thiol-disulfide oxidoreductase n=1 Tax=Stieleria varia TaxID=2528005 RepID=A0A5C6B1Q4_9BACT|nr:redoxin domain-containing protein [Stieleria varia]TWU05757.1 thiol-disulfide oxidoreductase [Stieleria varia]
MKTLLTLALLTCVWVSCTNLVSAEFPPGFQELSIGDDAPEFKLPGIDGRDWTLKDFSEGKVLVVYFTSNHCPVCHAHDPRFVEMLRELKGQETKGQSIAVVAINPNSGDGLRPDELGYSKYNDSFEDMTPYAKEHGFTFPYLYDGATQATAKRYGCLATPHVFVFDAQRKLQYKGRLDNSRYPDPSTVKEQDAKNAIVALLADQPVPVQVTKPFGCSTKWREKIADVKRDEQEWQNTPVTLDDIDAAGLAKLVANDTEKYRLFNVWSTSCLPCLEEFPGLIAVSRRMGLRPFELITLSTDLPDDRERVRKFLSGYRAALPKRLEPSLKQEGRTSNNYLFTDPDADSLINTLDPEWEGPQPHTVLVAPGGKVVFRHNGKISEEKLLTEILQVMTETYQP